MRCKVKIGLETGFLLSPLLQATWEQSPDPAPLLSPESAPEPASPDAGSCPVPPAPADPPLLFVFMLPPFPPGDPDPAPASPEPPAAPAPSSSPLAPPGELVSVVRAPPLQVRRHWPLEQEELTEEHEPEQRSSPPHETRHRPLLHEVDRPKMLVSNSVFRDLDSSHLSCKLFLSSPLPL